MTPHTLFNREEWEKQLGGGEYFVIAHLLDEVLIGDESVHREKLQKAVNENTLLEAHFFNEDKEIFVSKLDQQLMMYQPLEHDHKSHEENEIVTKIVRSYNLDQSTVNQEQNHVKAAPYRALEVVEYLKYDKESHLAYVDKTVLYRLTKE
ncbi:hypothetical protein ACE3MS_09415 [Paenibacillus dendritiformis]|uniref:hypothetical protein n=1 Tax=Paenibacillus dendritiformis TaxID=130049 RepID=UPI00365DC866